MSIYILIERLKALEQGEVIEVTYRGSRKRPSRNNPKTEIFYFVGLVNVNETVCIGVTQRKGPPWTHTKVIPLENINRIIRYSL
jgi:hypothetical protein